MFRRIIAALLVIVAALLAPFAVGAYWVEQTLMDSRQFTETIAPLSEDPQVRHAIETEATTAIIEALDVEQRLPAVLPDALTQAIASGVNSAVSDGVSRYVDSDRFGTLWTRVAQGLQEGFVRLVNKDDNGAVTLQDGQLVLNTTDLLTQVQQQLVADDIPFVGSVDMTKYGKDVVLADTPNLQTVADALAVFLPVARWLWLLVVVMFAAGIALWRPRSRGLLWTGLGLAIGGAVTWGALDLGLGMVDDSAPTPALGSLISAVLETLVRFLANALLVMVALGIALFAAAWLAGATRSGRRVRDAIRRTAHRVGAPWADGPIGRATSRIPLLTPALRAVVILGALWWAIAADPLHPGTVGWILVTVGALLFGIEVLEGAGRGRDGIVSGAVALGDPDGLDGPDGPDGPDGLEGPGGLGDAAGLGTPPLATSGAAGPVGGGVALTTALPTTSVPTTPVPATPGATAPGPTAPLPPPVGSPTPQDLTDPEAPPTGP